MKFMILKVLLLILILLLFSFVSYVRNRVFVKKVKFLEELLDSRLHCTFSFVRPTVEICGKYKSRIVEFRSYMDHIGRSSKFILISSKLPKQKKLIVNYPRVAENVYQQGDTLVYCVRDIFTFKIATLGKSGVMAILDELVKTAEKAERGGAAKN